MSERVLVTGGSGYFGSLLIDDLLARGYAVRSLDISDATDRRSDVEFVLGDIRDEEAVRAACDGIDVVYHNVAQVPLARDRHLFHSVNVTGTALLLDAALDAGVRKVVHTSSSAVFGVPESNPVTEDTPPAPVEAYGRAKLDAELLCRAAWTRGLDVSIVRPRTILGHGRLGIFGILFDWIADGTDVFVLGSGDNVYQFVHAADLAEACALAGAREGPAIYNIGTERYGSMRQALEALTAHAGTGARVRSLPRQATAVLMQLTSRTGMTPFAPYHWIMYGKSMYFDTAKAAHDLGWSSKYSNEEMFVDSYEWFLANRSSLGPGRSHHRSLVRQGVLGPAKTAVRLAGRLAR